MGRIPTAGEVAARLHLLVRRNLTDHPCSIEKHIETYDAYYEARERLVRVVNVLHTSGMPHVSEALATVLVEIGREIAPQPYPLRLHKNRHPRRRHRRNR